MGVIDSHCHLNHARTADGDTPASLVARARDSGVCGVLNICCRMADEFEDVLSAARNNPNVWCTLGTHPHEAGVEIEKVITLDEMVSRAQADDKIIGFGESGLDYFYDLSPRDDQEISFRKHINAAQLTDLPLVIHARGADDDLIRILREEQGGGARLRGVMHCFSSGPDLAEKALEEGLFISFSGIITFQKAQALRDVAQTIPLSRLLVETDSPYLAPEPYRGRTNEPAYLIHTVKVLADLHQISEEDMSSHCNENFFNLFSKARKTWKPL